MNEKIYTYQLYNEGLFTLKTFGVIIAFAILGLAIGLSEGTLTILPILAGITNGTILVIIAKQFKMSYTLEENTILIAINFHTIPLPTLRRRVKYEEITDIEWEPNPPYNLGYNPLGDMKSHHYNLGGEHIRIKRANKKDVTFSATKDHLTQLTEKLPLRQHN